MAIEYPAYGQLRVSNELKKTGILVSPGRVRSIWLRNDLNIANFEPFNAISYLQRLHKIQLCG